jgi:hypothetical protein
MEETIPATSRTYNHRYKTAPICYTKNFCVEAIQSDDAAQK